MKPYFLAALAVLIAVTAGCSSNTSASANNAKNGRKPAPDFSLPDEAGKKIKLSDYKGKVVLLDFWTTWCGPCKIEIPWFIEFQRKYKDRGFTVLGVSLDEGGWQAVKPFAEEYKMNYPVLLGADETAASFGGVEVLPTTFIIDKEGRVVAKHEGLTSKDEFEDAIKRLL